MDCWRTWWSPHWYPLVSGILTFPSARRVEANLVASVDFRIQANIGNMDESSGHPPMLRLASIVYFMGSSMLVQFTTKALFTTYGFHFPVTVALLQMGFISIVTFVVSKPEISMKLFRALAPLAIINVLNVVSGLVGTGGLNVPMFIALRRFTLLFTILLEKFWLNKTHDWPTLSAMMIMIGGALIAAATDLTFSVGGYAAVLCNDLLTSLYLIMVKNAPVTKGLTTTRMLFYNSTLSIPMLLIAMLAMGEPSKLLLAPQLHDPNFLFVLFMASGLGLSINHSTFVCTRINEPLMTSVAGNLKNAVMTIVGALAFPDFVFDPANALGLSVSMTGAIWYATRSALKARQKSVKDSLLQQQPVIGRDRLRKLSGSQDDSGNFVVQRNDSLEMRISQAPVSQASAS